MMAMRFTNAQVLLIALCAVLGAALIYELFAPLREYRPPAVDNTHAAYTVALPALYTPPTFDTYANIDEKSVFNPLRTPIVTDAGGIGTAAGDSLPSDLALVGVILDGPTKMALLKSSTQPLAVGVPEGGVFEGWRVANVEADKVVFAAHGDTQELKLSDNKRPAAPDADQSDQSDKSDDASSDNSNAPTPPLHIQPQIPPKGDNTSQ